MKTFVNGHQGLNKNFCGDLSLLKFPLKTGNNVGVPTLNGRAIEVVPHPRVPFSYCIPFYADHEKMILVYAVNQPGYFLIESDLDYESGDDFYRRLKSMNSVKLLGDTNSNVKFFSVSNFFTIYDGEEKFNITVSLETGELKVEKQKNSSFESTCSNFVLVRGNEIIAAGNFAKLQEIFDEK